MTCCKDGPNLKHRVTLQRETKEEDGQGGYESSWSDLITVWAEVLPIGAREKIYAMQLKSPASHKVTIRYRAGLTSNDRLVFRGNIYDIKECIDPKADRRYLKLLCLQSGQDGGAVSIDEQDTPWSELATPFDDAETIDTLSTPVEHINRPINSIG